MDRSDANHAPAIDNVWSWFRIRVRLVGSAVSVGLLLAGITVPVITIQYELRFVSTQLFVLSALCFGFGLLGWSGSILVGPSAGRAKRHLDISSNWTEADSRRAMARIGGFGFGAMMGVIVVVSLLRSAGV